MTHVSIIICVDVDPDGFNVPGVKFNKRKTKLSWQGLEKEVPRLIDFLNSLKDTEGDCANLSWFLRSDEQINELYGDYGWLYNNYHHLWKIILDRGDEIAWHPHFYRWFEDKGSWNQETKDVDWMLTCLENGFNRMRQLTGEAPSVRMGWGFHNNQTMTKLNDLGVETELSAVPGFKSEGKILSGILCDCHDWSITPDEPYFPSKSDYRRPNKDRLEILEIPMTVSRDPLPYALFGMAVDNKFRSPPSKFHLTPIKDPKKFFLILKRQVRMIKHGEQKRHIGMYFHPTDMLSKDALGIFKTNLSAIPELMKKEKVTYSFDCAKEAAVRIRKGLSI
ncbi:MAG: hypothetical protein JSW28_03080 [Thermoplasmata archaeon]|nr:MAG: hypothetical protein JSW28_03080 [Thermoplasmata archaeon]